LNGWETGQSDNIFLHHEVGIVLTHNHAPTSWTIPCSS
jgi:hypothetical protein